MPSRKPKTEKKPPPTEGNTQRLQRAMAAAGIGSRRECEIIIEEGRVEVDGTIAELGVKVDPTRQKIFVDGQPLVLEPLQYFVLNKPPGIVSTSSDPSGRPRVIDLIKTNKRVYNVGRLDQSSEGLILVTNDGDLANKLTHPRYGIEKKYHVQVAGAPAPADLRSLEKGVYLAEGKAKATSARFLRKVKNSSWIEIVLAEGRNREIRRMLSSIGHKVRTLKRVAIGPLRLGDLPVGAHRPLTPYELKALERAASGESKPGRSRKKTGARKGTKKTAAKKTASSRSAFAHKKKPGGRKASTSKKKASTGSGSTKTSKKKSTPKRGKRVSVSTDQKRGSRSSNRKKSSTKPGTRSRKRKR